MMPALYEKTEQVIFHFPKDESQWPVNTIVYPKARAKMFDGYICRVALRKWMLNSYYYILEELGNMWIKESFLEPMTPEIPDNEFEKLLEV